MNINIEVKHGGFSLLDLAQKTMDGFKEAVVGTGIKKGGNNPAAMMMQGMPAHVTALLWALVRSTEVGDRHFALLQNFLVTEVRLVLQKKNIKFTKTKPKEVAKGVSRSAITQFLFKRRSCQKCKGLRLEKAGETYKPCSACRFGLEAYTQTEKHKLSNLEVTRQTYLQTYLPIESCATEILLDWYMELDMHLRKYFKYEVEEYDL
ncbi:hypothetical protein [Acinetobacter sp. D009]|uniref:hypothetical protein n=1 Tax=Acinetobacter sp. D009 TaxID=3138069 RepID=UPI0031450A6B